MASPGTRLEVTPLTDVDDRGGGESAEPERDPAANQDLTNGSRDDGEERHDGREGASGETYLDVIMDGLIRYGGCVIACGVALTVVGARVAHLRRFAAWRSSVQAVGARALQELGDHLGVLVSPSLGGDEPERCPDSVLEVTHG